MAALMVGGRQTEFNEKKIGNERKKRNEKVQLVTIIIVTWTRVLRVNLRVNLRWWMKMITMGKVPMIVCTNWTEYNGEGGRRACEWAGPRERRKIFGVRLPSREQRLKRSRRYRLRGRCKKRSEENDMGEKKPILVWRNSVTPQNYSKAYSTATEHASLDCASCPCWRRLCRVGKKASQAGHECISSKETVLRSEHTLEEESDERERLEAGGDCRRRPW